MRIEAVGYNTAVPAGNPSRTTLDTYQFLRLLVVELTSQNPMEPLRDREFLAQMAQLNTAQQIERLGTMLTAFQATSLIGREVEASLPNGTTLTGKVHAVQLSAGKVMLRLENQTIPLDAVRVIR